jgi:hypothetical protein
MKNVIRIMKADFRFLPPPSEALSLTSVVLLTEEVGEGGLATEDQASFTQKPSSQRTASFFVGNDPSSEVLLTAEEVTSF